MKNLEVQLVWPPVPVRWATAGRRFVSSACYRTLALFIHLCSPFFQVLICTASRDYVSSHTVYPKNDGNVFTVLTKPTTPATAEETTPVAISRYSVSLRGLLLRKSGRVQHCVTLLQRREKQAISVCYHRNNGKKTHWYILC